MYYLLCEINSAIKIQYYAIDNKKQRNAKNKGGIIIKIGFIKETVSAIEKLVNAYLPLLSNVSNIEILGKMANILLYSCRIVLVNVGIVLSHYICYKADNNIGSID